MICWIPLFTLPSWTQILVPSRWLDSYCRFTDSRFGCYLVVVVDCVVGCSCDLDVTRWLRCRLPVGYILPHTLQTPFPVGFTTPYVVVPITRYYTHRIHTWPTGCTTRSFHTAHVHAAGSHFAHAAHTRRPFTAGWRTHYLHSRTLHAPHLWFYFPFPDCYGSAHLAVPRAVAVPVHICTSGCSTLVTVGSPLRVPGYTVRTFAHRIYTIPVWFTATVVVRLHSPRRRIHAHCGTPHIHTQYTLHVRFAGYCDSCGDAVHAVARHAHELVPHRISTFYYHLPHTHATTHRFILRGLFCAVTAVPHARSFGWFTHAHARRTFTLYRFTHGSYTYPRLPHSVYS